MKGFFALVGIWSTWFISHMSEIKEGFSILASVAAFVASVVYIIYYVRKMIKEK